MATTTKEVTVSKETHHEEKKDKKDGKDKKAYEYDGPVYRPLVSPRTTIITRSAYGPNAGIGGKSVTSSVVANRGVSSYSSHVPAGAYAKLTQTGVTNVRNDRQKEKKDMQDLNERLGSYIEKVRFLEAQNRRLVDELDKLKLKWGKETGSIKAMFQAELDEARKLLVHAEKEKAHLEIRCAGLEDQVEELRNKADEANARVAGNKDKLAHQDQQLSDYEAELNLLRRRCESLQGEHDRHRKEVARLQDALNRARIDLDNETLNHVDAENRRQTLEEELEFLKQVQEQEMKELQALAYRDTTQENRDFWKNEMGNALHEIQSVYEEKIELMRSELETYYNMKIQEFRTGSTRQNMETVHAKEESKKLRSVMQDMRQRLSDAESKAAHLEKELEHLRREFSSKEREMEAENFELKEDVAKLRAEMEAILKELQDIMDAKLGLELEISAYRKLLEGEENRAGLRQVVESIINEHGDKDHKDHKDKKDKKDKD